MAVLHYLRREHDRKKRNTYRGVISDVNAAGIGVFLDDFLVEGLVKMSSLVSDYFRVNRKARRLEGVRSRKTYTVGQRVQVRVRQVDLIGKEIELVLVRR